MTTKRIEDARLTDEEILGLPAKDFTGSTVSPRVVSDAATAKALRIEDVRRKRLVEALEACLVAIGDDTDPRAEEALDLAQAALKGVA